MSYMAWLDEVAARARFGRGDRVGTANYIDDEARRRAAQAMRTGRCVSLARPLQMDKEITNYAVDYVSVDVSHGVSQPAADAPPGDDLPVNSAFDVLHAAAHGPGHTHLDSFNHCGFRGEWYSGYAVDDPEGPSVMYLANHRLFTRGVVVDIPALRGTEWLDPQQPVTGADLDEWLARTGVTFEPGDALLLYMGRDRFEAAGHVMDLWSGADSPGPGDDAARWIVDHGVSLLCWDFLDASHSSVPARSIHSLIWATGLVLVDNCHLGPAAEQARQLGSQLGGLVVAPPPLPKATGSLVAPMFIQ